MQYGFPLYYRELPSIENNRIEGGSPGRAANGRPYGVGAGGLRREASPDASCRRAAGASLPQAMAGAMRAPYGGVDASGGRPMAAPTGWGLCSLKPSPTLIPDP